MTINETIIINVPHIGFISFTGNTIEHLYVKRKFRNNGIGSRLIEKAIAMNCNTVKIKTNNKTAIQLFEKHRFETTLSDDEKYITMVLKPIINKSF